MAEAGRSKAEAAGAAPGSPRENLEDLLKRIATHISEVDEDLGRPLDQGPPDAHVASDGEDQGARALHQPHDGETPPAEPPALRSGLSQHDMVHGIARSDEGPRPIHRAGFASEPTRHQPATTRPGARNAESSDNAGMGMPSSSEENASLPPLRSMLGLMAAVPRSRAAGSRVEEPAGSSRGATSSDPIATADRLADVARRIEDALATLAPREAVDRLGDRFSHLETELSRATTELARLDGIEARLGVLSTRLTDEQIVALFGPLVPTADDLARFAEDAAGRVAERMPAVSLTPMDESRGAASADGSEGQIKELSALLTSYVDECRRRDAGTQEALETLQLAMQHVLDRMDGHVPDEAADMPSASHAESEVLEPAPFEQAFAAPERMPEEIPAHVGFEHDIDFRAAMAPDAHAAGPGLAPTVPPAAGRSRAAPHECMREPLPDATYAGRDARGDRAAPLDDAFREHSLDAPRPHQPRPDSNPRAMLATARRSTAASGDGTAGAPAPKGEKAARVSRFGWLLFGTEGSTTVAGIRPGVLVVTSLAAFLLAGYWLFSSPKGGTPGSAQPATIERAEPQSGMPQAAQPQSAEPSSEPQPKGIADRDPPAAPAVDLQEASIGGEAAQTVGPGMSVVLAGHSTTLDQVVQARERARMANLSQRTGFAAARSYSAPPGTSPIETSAIAPAPADAASAAAAPATSLHLASAASARNLALPPAAAGPLSLRLAAAQGNASAQLEIATRLAEGKGIKQNFAEAAQWYERSAAQGEGIAQYRLATLYERGMGVPVDRTRAKTLYRQAADAGNVKAMHNLAVMSAGTQGATPDYVTAAALFGKAAGHGLTDSQYNLGVLYESGLGVPKDMAVAYRWYTLAARNGDREAARRRDVLIARLPPATLAAMDVEVAAWRPTTPDPRANDARVAGEAWKQREATIRR